MGYQAEYWKDAMIRQQAAMDRAQAQAKAAQLRAQRLMEHVEKDMALLGEGAVRMGAPGLAIQRHEGRGRPVKKETSETMSDWMDHVNKNFKAISSILQGIDKRITALESGKPELTVTGSLLCDPDRKAQFQIDR